MKTFVTRGNLECQLHFKFWHHLLSKLCIFHYSLGLDDNHWRDSMEQWYKRLVVACKNGVWPRQRKSLHNIICSSLFLQTRLCCCISHFAHDSCTGGSISYFRDPQMCHTLDWEMRERVEFHIRKWITVSKSKSRVRATNRDKNFLFECHDDGPRGMYASEWGRKIRDKGDGEGTDQRSR